MPNEFPVDSPEWWVYRLDRRLRAQRPAVRGYQRYYDGEHRLTFATEKFRQTFGGLFGNLSDNWTALVVDAVAERLKVNGFRIGDDSAGDSLFWDIWQRNAMDAESKVAFVDSLISGRAYVTVWSEAGNPGTAELAVDSAEQMIVDVDPGARRTRRAAWKVYRDDLSGHLLGVLYKPEGLYKFESANPIEESREFSSDSTRWQRREVRGEEWPLRNPLKVVPVVPLSNRRRLLRSAQSEIANTVPMQDVCNKLLADLLVTSEFQSFRQRWVTGMDIPVDPETNQPVEPFKSAVDRLFVAESAETKFGEFGEVNLAGYISAIELAVQHIASQSRTPPHYFYLKGNLPSGESIKSAETGLVAKARDKMTFYGEELEEIARLAFLVEGEDGKAEAAQSGETIWADPEYRTEGEHVDAVLKKKSLGIPEEVLWEELGYTQTEIARIKEIKRANALTLAAASVPPRVVPVLPAPGAPPGAPAAPVEGNGSAPAAVPAG
jgi:hypothetical protein